MSTARIQSLPHLSPGEVSLLDLAADDPRDVVSLSDKEALILQLYNQIQELELEKALLQQGTRQFIFLSLIYLLEASTSVSPGR